MPDLINLIVKKGKVGNRAKMASHDIGRARGDKFDDIGDDSKNVKDNHKNTFLGFGADINLGLSWYGDHQCDSSRISK